MVVRRNALSPLKPTLSESAIEFASWAVVLM
jgi:hypothetical protein